MWQYCRYLFSMNNNCGWGMGKSVHIFDFIFQWYNNAVVLQFFVGGFCICKILPDRLFNDHILTHLFAQFHKKNNGQNCKITKKTCLNHVALVSSSSTKNCLIIERTRYSSCVNYSTSYHG